MGNNESSKINVTDYDHREWKVIGTHKSVSEIVQSSKGQSQAERQILHLDPKLNLDKEIEIYQYRKNQDNALVKCIAVHVQQAKTKSICGNSQVLTVLIQRIPLRLNQLPQLTFEQSIYALSESLRGYKDCYNKLGPFEVADEMIGINNDGEIKVWVNPDFSENHPLTEKPLLHTSGTFNPQNERTEDFSVKRDQAQMVQNIVRLVQAKCQSGRFPSDFDEKIKKSSSNFDKAFKVIESYVLQKNLFIPDRIINMKTTYSKGKYFTSGEQYSRDKNEPFYRQRKPFLPEPKDSRIQFSQTRPLNFDTETPQGQQLKRSNQNGYQNSPILSLYQQQYPVKIDIDQTFLHSPRSQAMKPIDLHKQVTLKVISPEVSTLVFNQQSCVYPHQILQKR